MLARCYNVNITPDHSTVVYDTARYLSTLTAHEHNVRELLWGAARLVVEISSTTAYNYMTVEQNGVTWFYFLMPTRRTPVSYAYDAIIDWWATETAKNPVILQTATIIAGHVLPEYTECFTLPVSPVVGDFMRTRRGQTTSDVTVCMSCTIDDGDISRPTLICSPSCDFVTEGTRITGYVGNMSRALSVDDKEILTISKMWLLPSEYALPVGLPAPTHTLKTGGGNIPVYWQTGAYNVRHIQENYPFFARTTDGNIIPVITYMGNFGTNIEMPINGFVPRPTRSFWSFNFNAGTVSAVLTYGDTDIDLLPSLSVDFTAIRTDTREIDNKINDGISLVGGVLATVGGIASGNPFIVGAGGLSVTSTVGRIATRQNKHLTPINGAAVVNMVRAYGDDVSYTHATGAIQYYSDNDDEVMCALRGRGYDGKAILKNVDISTIGQTSKYTHTYNSVYMRFSDARISSVNINPEAAAEIRQMCLNGFTMLRGDFDFSVSELPPICIDRADDGLVII